MKAKAKKKSSGIGVFPPDQALLTAEETCNVLKISRRTLWSWSNGQHGLLKPVKIAGGPTRWIVGDVQKLIRISQTLAKHKNLSANCQ